MLFLAVYLCIRMHRYYFLYSKGRADYARIHARRA